MLIEANYYWLGIHEKKKNQPMENHARAVQGFVYLEALLKFRHRA